MREKTCAADFPLSFMGTSFRRQVILPGGVVRGKEMRDDTPKGLFASKEPDVTLKREVCPVLRFSREPNVFAERDRSLSKGKEVKGD